MSRWVATSSIHRDVIHAHGHAGSNQKSTTGMVGFSGTRSLLLVDRTRLQSHPQDASTARRDHQVST
jgi:hypothetical protein